MRKKISLVLSFAVLSGCNYFTYYKELEADKRLAIVTEKKEYSGGNEFTRRITCSEPSPDALTALAASLSGETNAGVSIAAAYSENAASIGLRTQSIQLLRDQLFSICQAYANEGLSSYTYQTLLAKNQQNTIALMAIEQLTGVLKAPNATITTSAEATSSDVVRQRRELAIAESDLSVILDKESEKAKELASTVAALKKSLHQTQGGKSKAKGSMVAETGANYTSSVLTEQNVTTITDAILKLVDMTNTSTESVNTMFVCTDILQTSSYRGKAESGVKANYTPLEASCENFITQRFATDISKLANDNSRFLLQAKIISGTKPQEILKSENRSNILEAIEATKVAPSESSQ